MYTFTLADHPFHGRMVRVEDVVGYLTSTAVAVRRRGMPNNPLPPSLLDRAAASPQLAIMALWLEVRVETLEVAAAKFTALLADPEVAG